MLALEKNRLYVIGLCLLLSWYILVGADDVECIRAILSFTLLIITQYVMDDLICYIGKMSNAKMGTVLASRKLVETLFTFLTGIVVLHAFEFVFGPNGVVTFIVFGITFLMMMLTILPLFKLDKYVEYYLRKYGE